MGLRPVPLSTSDFGSEAFAETGFINPVQTGTGLESQATAS